LLLNPEPQDPTLNNVLDHKALKWIFVGGKGGVGKTTTSCSLAIQLAKVRESVLIISTDPAHNLSDALCQKFSLQPEIVNGFSNLYAMEIESKLDFEEMNSNMGGLENFIGNDPSFMQDFAMSFPGIDEAMSFAEVLNLIQTMKFSVIVFDTAPTGHTLRFLALPSTLEKGLGKLFALKNKFASMFQQVSTLFGGAANGMNIEGMMTKLENTKKIIEEANKQFKNADLTTFICVCIPEFLSVFETERLVQELTKVEMDTQNVVVNQILFPDHDKDCHLCMARSKMQKKYLDQIDTLYDDFHIVKMPLLENEIRGIQSLTDFSQFLLSPYHASK